ncbi:hypothetical protein ZWY2020_008150 [Hordeum vulgare]|nr:hypothetical protein ZWY2020_008150 [Hordeum vulgare]
MLCPLCHSYCKNDNEQRFVIFIRNGFGDLVINKMSGLKSKAHRRRYVVDVFRGHSTTLIGGDDWAKFKRDFNLGEGQVVVFDMCGRMAQAYVNYVGSGLAADHGAPEHYMGGGDVVEEGEAGAFGVVGEEDKSGSPHGHGLEAAPNIIYTRGVVLNDGEEQMLGLVLTIQDGYIGPHFVHRLTPTNITSKLIKIPKNFFQQLNLARKGVMGLCMGIGDVMQVRYHMDCDGWLVFNKDCGLFATQYHLQADDVVVFNFKESDA